MNKSLESSNHAEKLSMKALRSSWMGGYVVAFTFDRPLLGRKVSRLGIQV